MERRRLSLSIPVDVYERLEDIREKRRPMAGLIADILQFHADNHGNIITRDEHMEAMGRKDETIQEMSRLRRARGLRPSWTQ